MEYKHIHYKSFHHIFLQFFTSDLQYKYQIVFNFFYVSTNSFLIQFLAFPIVLQANCQQHNHP
jgi:hypothetical protein